LPTGSFKARIGYGGFDGKALGIRITMPTTATRLHWRHMRRDAALRQSFCVEDT
jgi:hypothetical protein